LDFEPIVANFGDTVNTRRPGQFVGVRKVPADPVTVQNATALNVQVPLNQHVHVSFLIKDGEESKSFKDLITEYMYPAMLAQARFLDQIVLGQWPQFMANQYGQLGTVSGTNIRGNILGVRNKMNTNKAYFNDRNMIFTPNSETQALQLDLFVAAQQVGDDGTALREASLGRKLGFDMFMCQNASSVSPLVVATDADTTTTALAAGATSLVLTTGSSTSLVPGAWITIAGDGTPLQIATWTAVSKTATLNPATPVRTATLTGAAVTIYHKTTVNQAVAPTGYAAGWSKEIVLASVAGLAVGQLISFSGDQTNWYTILQVDPTGVGVVLDRPLVLAIANSDNATPGPAGEYNFAFHRNALALVCRPLSMPRPGTGALSAVVNWNDLSMRATITYQGTQQGHLVTLDLLCGIAVLDTNLGCIMLG
jgi:hypothetical protein